MVEQTNGLSWRRAHASWTPLVRVGTARFRTIEYVVSPRHARLCPPYEAVNLSYFTGFDSSQINDLATPKTGKSGKIHIRYDPAIFLYDAAIFV